jgi:hypothetical protein
MFTRAKRILSSELTYALNLDEEQVEEHIYGLLGVAPAGNGRKLAVAAE